jgi:transcriptional regulator with XRE-family HTH domain
VRNFESLLMPPNSERARAPGFPDSAADTTMDSRQSFCLALKAARERRGVTLAQIAEATKVCVSLFAALERNDLRSWPKGLFRRGFFRGYVEMVGLPVAETTDEFVRLFPDTEAATPSAPAAADASAPRLSLDASWHGPRPPMAWRIVIAMIDAVVVLAVAAALVWLAGTHAGTTIAVVSVSYFTLATLLGDGATASVIRWFRARPPAQPEEGPDESIGVVARAWRFGVTVAANVFGGRGEDTPAESVESRERTWTSDARRVSPHEVPPRLRVRFKLP